ncbi:mucin-5AC-like isoform X2 [Neocloeon triangulifer]|uniref:mucin-5AC-like isoform X2 n=1 Tax=Neocloeon triangulifer TaxID=2078957 RepID=UPI00286EFCFC|nr:mucin-5AC-like isoform X2 [Neocloeon triangulifer]
MRLLFSNPLLLPLLCLEILGAQQVINVRAVLSGVSSLSSVRLSLRSRRVYVVRCCGGRSCLETKPRNDTEIVYQYEDDYGEDGNATTSGGTSNAAEEFTDTTSGEETTASAEETSPSEETTPTEGETTPEAETTIGDGTSASNAALRVAPDARNMQARLLHFVKALPPSTDKAPTSRGTPPAVITTLSTTTTTPPATSPPTSPAWEQSTTIAVLKALLAPPSTPPGATERVASLHDALQFTPEPLFNPLAN